MLAILMATSTCLAGETWVFDWTVEEVDDIPEGLRPYVLVGEDLPPAIVDVEALSEGLKDHLTTHPQHSIWTESRPWKIIRYFSPEGQEVERHLVTKHGIIPKVGSNWDGLAQHWYYYKSLEDGPPHWGWTGVWCYYELFRFQNNSHAQTWFLEIRTQEERSRNVSDYQMGDRAITVDNTTIYVVKDNIGFHVTVPVDPTCQPDETLLDKLASIIYARIEANPPGPPQLVEKIINLTGEKWTFPVTFEEYNVSETLEPYLITEEEWPPVVVDVDAILKGGWGILPDISQEDLEELKALAENSTKVRIGAPTDVLYQHYADQGFQQTWGDAISYFGTVSYVLLHFKDEEDAVLWFLNTKEKYKMLVEAGTEAWGDNILNMTLNDYPMGDRGMVMDMYFDTSDKDQLANSMKGIFVKTGNLGFYTAATIGPYQPDEMLPEKMAGIVAKKLGIPETGILLGLLGIGILFKKRS